MSVAIASLLLMVGSPESAEPKWHFFVGGFGGVRTVNGAPNGGGGPLLGAGRRISGRWWVEGQIGEARFGGTDDWVGPIRLNVRYRWSDCAIRPSFSFGVAHHHELAQEFARDDPAGTIFGTSSETRHRTGLMGGGGVDVLFDGSWIGLTLNVGVTYLMASNPTPLFITADLGLAFFIDAL